MYTHYSKIQVPEIQGRGNSNEFCFLNIYLYTIVGWGTRLGATV